MPSLPTERALFASYELWRKHADPDGLVSVDEFAEMDEDDKREALRELGGIMPAVPGDENADADDETLAAESAVGEDADEEEADAGSHRDADLAHRADDALAGDVVELTEDVVDERTADPFA